jgi:hypothetical protein
MPLHVRQWQCPVCSVVHDRDVNAAQNIVRVGIEYIKVAGREPPELTTSELCPQFRYAGGVGTAQDNPRSRVLSHRG